MEKVNKFKNKKKTLKEKKNFFARFLCETIKMKVFISLLGLLLCGLTCETVRTLGKIKEETHLCIH